MPGKKAAVPGRRSGGGIGRFWLLPAAASGCSGGGIGRLRLRPAIPGGRGKRQSSAPAAAAAPSLPDDALVDILSRVPARSLCRFKCVSKAWRDLIADRLRCTNLPQTLAGFFLNDIRNNGGGVGEHRVVGHLVDTLGRFTPLASISFLGKQPGIEEFSLFHSCNGLLLFGHKRHGDKYDSLGYIVCNPATEQWVAVPNSGWKPFSLSGLEEIEDPASYTEPNSRFTYLIFDPAVSSHFQLVEFQMWMENVQYVEEVQIYSSQTGVWRWCNGPDECGFEEDEGISFFTGSALVNGMLHLGATRFATHEELIIAVDGQGRECWFISGPEKRADVAFVGQSQGCLHYMTQHRDSTSEMTALSIWVLQDYDAEEWVLKHSVTFLQLFGRTNCDVEFDYKVVAIHPDRNLIFFVQRWDLKLKSYDMDTKEVCVVRTLGIYCDICPYVPYFPESSALAYKH
ncbi:unnamed protein product [Urochloa decumbens]|uniref:F-box domain-containing protein n=1 Tax=Urochloa decumbens TaxID=240449 RepID=A0ABC8W9N2_9POAL